MLPYVLNSSGPVLYIIKMNIAIIIYMLYLAQSYKNSKFLKNLNFNYSRRN